MVEGQLFDGKYRIVRILGHGGMGTVYLAENIKLGTLWAVKEVGKKQDTGMALPVEPEILKKLCHPALPRIFDIVEEDEKFFIIMDYVEGIPLNLALEEAGRFQEKTVLAWGAQLCDALKYLHTSLPYPIIYRDMKPSNIILTKNGTVKLIDFGIAREYKKDTGADTVYIGTRGYAAPEQYGIGQTDERTDIYSLGVTLYHLLTGKSPLEAPLEIKPAGAWNENVSEETEQIIYKCTRPDPKERYASTWELLQAIGRLQNTDHVNAAETKKDPGNHQPVRFRKVVFTVWDHAEFGCEFAYLAAKQTDYSVLLIDADLLAPKADLLLNVRKFSENIVEKGLFNNSGLDIAMDAIEKNVYLTDVLHKAAAHPRGCKNLSVLTGNYSLENYEYYSNETFEKLMAEAYRTFDITVILVNKSIYDAFTVIALLKSDYNLIPIRADIEKIREFNRYLVFLKEKQHIPMEKSKFVGYEYNAEEQLSLKSLQEVTEQNCCGTVAYSRRRAKMRNLRGQYLQRMEDHIFHDYERIFSQFGIVPVPSLAEWLKYRMKRFGRSFRALTKIIRARYRRKGVKKCLQ